MCSGLRRGAFLSGHQSRFSDQWPVNTNKGNYIFTRYCTREVSKHLRILCKQELRAYPRCLCKIAILPQGPEGLLGGPEGRQERPEGQPEGSQEPSEGLPVGDVRT